MAGMTGWFASLDAGLDFKNTACSLISHSLSFSLTLPFGRPWLQEEAYPEVVDISHMLGV